MNPEARKPWDYGRHSGRSHVRAHASELPARQRIADLRARPEWALQDLNFAKASPDHVAVVMIAPKVVSC